MNFNPHIVRNGNYQIIKFIHSIFGIINCG